MMMTEIEKLLGPLMRGIDKRTVMTLEPGTDENRPFVTVQLRCGKRSGTLQLTESDLVAAQTDLICRNRVRTALKRTRDRMLHDSGYIFSTKFDRQHTAGESWFHPSQRGRGRR